MPPSVNAPVEAKEFDARTAALVVGDGDPIEDIESFGYDQSKGHELQYTLDQNAIWVKSTPEITGSFVMKATSPTIPSVESMFLNDEVFSITAQLAEVDGEQESINFVGCILTDFSHSDYQIDDMPTISADWQGVNRGEN